MVAPFTGAWIEIRSERDHVLAFVTSLPSRERGLKFVMGAERKIKQLVAPFTGAWIEIFANGLNGSR